MKKRIVLNLKTLFNDFVVFKRNPYFLILIIMSLPLVYFIVYFTGGIKYVYSHSMYIPIILAGLYYGPIIGGSVALLAGILLGPLMPIDTITSEMQHPLNWIYRLLIFVLLGTIIGYVSDKLRKNAQKIENLMSVNQETSVPNINNLKLIFETMGNNTKYSIFTVLISNNHNIIDVLGIDVYYELIHNIYIDLKNNLSKHSKIIQAENNKLWILIPFTDLNLDLGVLINALSNSKQIRNIPLYIDYSIGGSVYFVDTKQKNPSIFKDSDISARSAHNNNLLYVLDSQERFKRRNEFDLLATFTESLNNGNIFLEYQPIMDLNTMKTYAFEALIRWNHPERGLVSPVEFIPLVEETKLIHILTDWVLTNALAKTKEMSDLGYKVPISINLSVKNLYDPYFFERTINIIDKSNVPFDLIILELTESTLMLNPNKSKQILQRFFDLGITISLDDFGSGYSSLAYLTQFPLNIIKIDRYFMNNILTDKSMISILQSIIELSKSLGHKVVVEGTETKDVVDLVKSLNSDYAQGYYFSKPLSSNATTEWFINH
ncbi:MAG: EAL domain-containing protein [Candidatus Izemoplasmatales bacterium]